uniref:Wsv222-like protein, paralog 1 n=1 Tax=Metapenaeus ensis nimavirus TaxID=2133794 RepID=A0A401IP82_9VIRU|nr:MAG: wsv222-like protein [Metapenaeus ensis nimavirus]GBG35429.1 wsv222-like protein, paralog 1 [Metapenaeus ensis nimavirus]
MSRYASSADDHVADLLVRTPQDSICKELRTIFKRNPMILHVDYRGQMLWAYIFSRAQPQMIDFILSCRTDYGLSIPRACCPVEENGNGILMAPINVRTLAVLMSKDCQYFCEALSYINERNGDSFFHYHCSRTQERESLVILWLSEICRNLPLDDLVTPDRALSDINLTNKEKKTPLQIAIEYNNPSAVYQLITLFGAYWFDDCLVKHKTNCGEIMFTSMTYIQLAEKLNRSECLQILHEADDSYRIWPNTSLRDLGCAICGGSESYDEHYNLTCRHVCHCICLMRMCASSENLKCPLCRSTMTNLEKVSPPTVFRLKHGTEEERAIMCRDRNHMALCTNFITDIVDKWYSRIDYLGEGQSDDITGAVSQDERESLSEGMRFSGLVIESPGASTTHLLGTRTTATSVSHPSFTPASRTRRSGSRSRVRATNRSLSNSRSSLQHTIKIPIRHIAHRRRMASHMDIPWLLNFEETLPTMTEVFKLDCIDDASFFTRLTENEALGLFPHATAVWRLRFNDRKKQYSRERTTTQWLVLITETDKSRSLGSRYISSVASKVSRVYRANAGTFLELIAYTCNALL